MSQAVTKLSAMEHYGMAYAFIFYCHHNKINNDNKNFLLTKSETHLFVDLFVWNGKYWLWAPQLGFCLWHWKRIPPLRNSWLEVSRELRRKGYPRFGSPEACVRQYRALPSRIAVSDHRWNPPCTRGETNAVWCSWWYNSEQDQADLRRNKTECFRHTTEIYLVIINFYA